MYAAGFVKDLYTCLFATSAEAQTYTAKKPN